MLRITPKAMMLMLHRTPWCCSLYTHNLQRDHRA